MDPLKEQQKNHLEYWNERYPIGTPVVALRTPGHKVMSYTSSAAQMEDGIAVIYLSGFSRPFPLERCKAITD